LSGRGAGAAPPLPPDRCTAVRAGSALVLAPHHDDEVLGCGGLLAQLIAAGAAVRVLFLTDGGGGGEEDVGDRDAYRARRRAEAAAVAGRMGFAGTDRLAIPDGELALRLDEAAAAIRRALVAIRPELLLVPAPTESSADHRAAFAALHRLLAPLRPGGAEPDALLEAVREVRVFAYEINRPGWPDLLVDVGAEVPLLAEAMALYASQQERRDYWRASLGLRRYRTLTLPPEVEAAEGYRRLALDDFVTRSPAQLARSLGAVPEVAEVREGPKISVVVRTRDRPALLAEALGSLAAGAYRRVEVVLVNDGGEPPEPPADYPLPLVRVDLAENRGRAAAAGAGVEQAGGDFVAFLDDDDLAAPEHLATLAGLVGDSGVRVAYTDAAVGVYELAGRDSGGGAGGGGGGWVCAERRLPYSRDFDPDLLLLDNYIPFNTLLIERALFAEVGPFDQELPFFEDWDFLIRLAARVAFHHHPRVTCEYRHFRGAGHHVLGESPRGRSDFLTMKARVLAKHAALLPPERLARAVDTLRRERVESAEAAAALGREADRLREERADLEDRYHRVHGEADALRRERERLAAETERLYGDERELRAVVADQDAHLGRTYGEIERLGGVIREIEATRAWRAHLWLERRRGRGPGGREPGEG
jgi:LmbE family N-acetylglucosaminyl deacetylase